MTQTQLNFLKIQFQLEKITADKLNELVLAGKITSEELEFVIGE